MPAQRENNESQTAKKESGRGTSSGKNFVLPPNFGRRIALMCVGILFMGLMLSVLMKLNLGTDPFSCFVKGFSKQAGISYGTAQLLVQLVLFVFVVLFARNLIGIGMIANMVFLGYITDFGTWVLDCFLQQSVWELTAVRYGLLIPSLALFIFGAALYMSVDLGMSPYDGMPFLITDTLNRAVKSPRNVPFRVVRMAWDFIFMTLGYFLGGIFGAVTVLQMLFLGSAISWVRKKIEPLLS